MKFKSEEDRDNFILENRKIITHLLSTMNEKPTQKQDYEDLYSECTIALIKAIDSYDEKKHKQNITDKMFSSVREAIFYWRKSNLHIQIPKKSFKIFCSAKKKKKITEKEKDIIELVERVFECSTYGLKDECLSDSNKDDIEE